MKPEEKSDAKQTPNNWQKTISWILAVVALVYDFSPVDIVPDGIPAAGWLDDIMVTVLAGLNLLQQYSRDGHPTASRILKRLKWGCVVVSVIVVAILALAVYGIISLFN
ncbi:MAG: YkvA family protein [Bacteroidales bacterium]|nr:YkvA family protein [Bacteroidales bacterium]MDD6669815.1 YkvA family protein [Bacteroidales bacterium]